MRANFLMAALAAALLCLTACDIEDMAGMGRYTTDFHYSYPFNPGGRIEVESFNGAVELSTWDRDTVDISGAKYGPTQESADNLKIDIDRSPAMVSIRVARPLERRNNQGARFSIKIPRGVTLDRIITSNGAIRADEGAGPARLRTSNGAIRVQSLSGNIDAQTTNAAIDLLDIDGDIAAHNSNGHIHVERVTGSLDATTSNSSVNAKLVGAGRGARVESSNGAVELWLPSGFRGGVRANTSNNSIVLRLASEPDAHVIAHTSNGSIVSFRRGCVE